MLSPEELRQRRKERILLNAADRIRKICTDDDGSVRAAPFFEKPSVPGSVDSIADLIAPKPNVGDEEVPTLRCIDDSLAVPDNTPVYEKKRVFSLGAVLHNCSFLITLIVGFLLALATSYDPELCVCLYWLLTQLVLSSLRFYFKDAKTTQSEIFLQLMLSVIDPQMAKCIEISGDLIGSVLRDTKSFMFSFVISSILLNVL